MNQVFIILDSVGYDKFVEAETPNFDGLGRVHKAYSTACWTLPSIYNMLSIGCHIGYPNLLPNKPPSWIPTKFKDNGFHTAFLSGNPWILHDKSTFTRGFDDFMDFDMEWVIDRELDWTLERMVDYATARYFSSEFGFAYEPFFVFMLVMDTHDYVPIKGFRGGSQIKAIEIADKELGKMFGKIQSSTRVVITSDHGDTEEGHNPLTLTEFNRELFEVPVVEGVLP